MSTMRARSLPRVREALEKAERARFYKQRTNKYTDEVRLVKALAALENERISTLARIKEQTMDLRMQALHIRDEEVAFLESDLARLKELMRKVEINKHRNFLQEVKYKPRRTRDQFVQRYERWKSEDAQADDWRLEMPPREPHVQLDEHLVYPAKRERKQNRQLYQEITRRPDSHLGEKAVHRLRDLYSDGRTEADRTFFEELETELNSARFLEAAAADEASPFVTQQLSLSQAVQERAMQRILEQIESTRRSIRFWELPASEGTRERLDGCCQTRLRRVRKARLKPIAPAQSEATTQDAGAVDDVESGVVTLEEDGQTEEAAPGEEEAAAERERVRKLSKRLSRGFRQEDFNRRRQSLLKELEEGDASPEERQRRMREFELAWTEVLKCKYIRGYEPPEMRLPEGQSATDFVFGEAQARMLESIVEEATAGQ